MKQRVIVDSQRDTGLRPSMRDLGEYWKRLRARFVRAGDAPSSRPTGAHTAQTSEALRALLDDPGIPAAVRGELSEDFAQIESLLDKLASGELHIAVFGRVSVGKSALGNALLGRDAFATGVLHGTTRSRDAQRWRKSPGRIAPDRHARHQRIVRRGTRAARLRRRRNQRQVIFVVDGDMKRGNSGIVHCPDPAAAAACAEQGRSLHRRERERLLARLREHAAGMVHAEDVIAAPRIRPTGACADRRRRPRNRNAQSATSGRRRARRAAEDDRRT
jgi:hypothetical protein